MNISSNKVHIKRQNQRGRLTETIIFQQKSHENMYFQGETR